MIGKSGERWSGISVLAARHDDDDEVYELFQEFYLLTGLESFLCLNVNFTLTIFV